MSLHKKIITFAMNEMNKSAKEFRLIGLDLLDLYLCMLEVQISAILFSASTLRPA